MPLLSNTFQATQYLKDVQDWSLNPIKSFTPIQALINAGVTVEQQRMLHFLDFLERMSIAGCDNTDPGKTHPAYIKDDDLRNEVDQVTKKMLLDLIIFRERFLDTGCFVVDVKSSYNAKSGPLRKSTLLAENFFYRAPPQFQHCEDIAGAFHQFQSLLSAVLVNHIGDFNRRLKAKDECFISPLDYERAMSAMFQRSQLLSSNTPLASHPRNVHNQSSQRAVNGTPSIQSGIRESRPASYASVAGRNGKDIPPSSPSSLERHPIPPSLQSQRFRPDTNHFLVSPRNEPAINLELRNRKNLEMTGLRPPSRVREAGDIAPTASSSRLQMDKGGLGNRVVKKEPKGKRDAKTKRKSRVGSDLTGSAWEDVDLWPARPQDESE